MKSKSVIERTYSRLLDRNYQEEIFGSLKGFEKKGEGYIACCPFHDDVLPTLIINSDSPGYFCFACGARGDWIDFLMKHKAMKFSDALKSLNRAASLRLIPSENEWKREFTRSCMLESAISTFSAMLFSEMGKGELTYLNSRGYMGEEIEHMGLGLFPGYKETLDFLDKEYSLAEISDVFSCAGNENRMIAIPYRDLCGRIMGIYGMSHDGEQNTYVPLTGMEYLKDTPLLMYKSRKQEKLVAVEGFFDAMLSDCIGVTGVIGVGNDGITPSVLMTAAGFGVRTVILALSGGDKTKRAIDLIRKKGLEVRVVILPGKYDDVDAYIRDTCINKLGKLVDRAVSPEEWLRIHTGTE
jgi:DNA primase